MYTVREPYLFDKNTFEMLYKSCGVGGNPMLSKTSGLESWGRFNMRITNPATPTKKIINKIVFLSVYVDFCFTLNRY